MTPEQVQLVLSIVTVPLFGWVFVRAWRDMRRDPDDVNREHGLVVSSALLIGAITEVVIAYAHIVASDTLDHLSVTAFRGMLLATAVYLVLRHPHTS